MPPAKPANGPKHTPSEGQVAELQKTLHNQQTRHQREKEDLEHEYKKELHERQSKFTERNNTLVKVIEGLKNEKKKIGEQYTQCAQELKRLQLTIKLAHNSQAAIAQINDEASSPVRSGQDSVLPGDKGAKNEAKGDKGAKNEANVEDIDNMDEEEVHVSQNRIKSVIDDKENLKNQVIVKGLSKKVTKPRSRFVTAPRALIGSHEFHTLSMIPENEMYHLGASQFHKVLDDMQTTIISAGNSNEIEDRSAYSLPSPFSLQAKATPVPLLWESDEGQKMLESDEGLGASESFLNDMTEAQDFAAGQMTPEVFGSSLSFEMDLENPQDVAAVCVSTRRGSAGGNRHVSSDTAQRRFIQDDAPENEGGESAGEEGGRGPSLKRKRVKGSKDVATTVNDGKAEASSDPDEPEDDHLQNATIPEQTPENCQRPLRRRQSLSYAEPSLHQKLRKGDPHTFNSGYETGIKAKTLKDQYKSSKQRRESGIRDVNHDCETQGGKEDDSIHDSV